MADHNELGKWGESVAREYMYANGYAICGENVRIAGVEIDFIAVKDNAMCFVEVKTRTDDSIDPMLSIDRRKQIRMAKAADSYMRTAEPGYEAQFDIIIVVGGPDSYRIEHIPDAFFPPLNGGFR